MNQFKRFLPLLSGLALALAPLSAFAQTTPPAGGATFASIVGQIVDVVNKGVIPLLYALAFISFLIGIVRYFFLGDGEESREKGKTFILWGIIGFVVIFSVWGIVHVFLSVLPGYGA